MTHDWRLFDAERGFEGRRLDDGDYEVREVDQREKVTRLTPDEFDQLRREGREPPGALMSNPNPSRITDEMWRLWEECAKVIPGVRLGGIYANTHGYHNTRNYLQANEPNNYSIQLTLDRQGPGDKAAAIDLTMSDAEMRKRTALLRKSALDPVDPRMECVREFYGTLDSQNVYGLIHDGRAAEWRRSTSDNSHLWHIHISIFRADVTNWARLSGVVSILAGETYEQWKDGDDMTPEQAKQLADVRYILGANTSGASDHFGVERAAIRAEIKEAKAFRTAVLAKLDGASADEIQARVRAALEHAAELERAERQAEYAALADELRTAMSAEMGAEAGEAAARVFAEIVARGAQPPA